MEPAYNGLVLLGLCLVLLGLLYECTKTEKGLL